MKRVPMAVAVALFSAAFVASAQTAGPNDAQIAAIVVTANQVDIDAGKVAQTRGSKHDIQVFGKQMVSDHTGVNKSATDLVKKLKVTPQDNDTSKAIAKGQADKRAELAKLDGKAFDKAYADNEVAYHKTVNGALESTLIPSSNNGELKSLLETGLKIFQGHQQHAEHVAADIK